MTCGFNRQADPCCQDPVILPAERLSKCLPFFVQMGEIWGPIMLNRLTVSALLKAVILTTAFSVVLGFSLNAWDSWGRVQLTSRISVVADSSANLFKAMHNLRTDPSPTN